MSKPVHWLVTGILSILTIFLSIYFYAWSVPDEPKVLPQEYRFFTQPCWFDADWTASIRCGELHTPAISGAFRLPVVILKDETAARREDPIVYLQGGPGAGARLHSEGIKTWLNWMRYAALGRDIILIDTRGTGRSSPALVCAEYNRSNQQVLGQRISLVEELALGFDVTQACFETAAARNTSLGYQHFSTEQSAHDVRALMTELEYTEWNILGVSYGTRLALEIAHQESLDPRPVKLKAMVLDSIYPAGFGGVQTWPQVLDEAVHNFFNGCAATKECSSVLSDSAQSVEQAFMEVLHHLRDTPMELTIRRWDGEVPVSFLLNDHRFLSAAFSATYSPRDWIKIAEAIRGVGGHRHDAVKPLIEPFVNNSMSDDFNSLTFTAVDCADNPVMDETDYLEQVKRYPLLQNYTRDQWRYQSCHYLVTDKPLQRHQPSVETLILSGELDPVTPVDWAKSVHSQWENTQLYISDNTAHAVLSSEACLLQSLVHFYDHPGDIFNGCD